MPLISVIVPVYKVEPYIRKCIDSILSQTFTDFELILVDDGSPDNCPVICDEYALKDKRIHVIHQKNGGLSVARNAGLDYAFGSSNSEWVTFIDSDDWVHKDYLAELLNMVISTGSKASACCIGNPSTYNHSNKKSDCYVVPFEDLYDVEITKVNPISAWGKLYKKELFDGIRYPVGRICEDLFITHQVLYKCEKIAVTDRELYIYFTDNESITRSAWGKKRFDEIEASEALITFMENNHLEKSRAAAIKRHIYVLHNQLIQIDTDSNKNDYTKERMIIQKKLEKALWQYRKEIPFSENKWHYEAAFPHTMNLYWIISGKVKKLWKKNF